MHYKAYFSLLFSFILFFPQNYLFDKTFSSLVWNLETFSEICIYIYIEIYVYYTAFFWFTQERYFC